MADSIKIKITGDSTQYEKTLNSLGGKAEKAFSGVGTVLKGMLGAQLVTKGFSALTGGIRSAINAGMEFEASMSQVAAISGATGAELEALTETAKAYGESTKFTASQAAEALNYMALAGWDAQQSMDALGGVLDLAAASGMDLGAASDAVTDYLSAFGMQASDASYMADLMAYAQSNANTSATQLAEAYGNCAASMHAAGQDIETTTSMLMALANQGIKGSEAGTQMAAVMRDLTQNMSDGQIQIGKTSVQVMDAAGNFRDLNEIMADVAKATEGMGTAEASAALMETFTARSVKAVQTILNEGTGAVNDYEAALRGAEGTAAEQSATMMDNLQGDVQIFNSALEGLQITASESFSGISREAVQMGTDIVSAINEAGKTGGLSGMLDAFSKQLPNVITKVSAMVGKVVQGVTRKLPDMIKGLVGSLPDMLAGAIEIAPEIAASLFETAGAAVEQLISDLPSLVPQLAQGIGKMFISAIKGVGSIVESAFSGLSQVALELGLRGMTTQEAIEAQLGKVDPAKVKELTDYAGTITYGFDTDADVDTTGAVTAIQEAIDTIKKTIGDLTGVDESEAQEITDAILRGSGYEALVAAFNAMDVPDAEAKATEIQTAILALKTACEGLGLPQEALNAVQEALINGADTATISGILQQYGIPEGEADAKAAEISAAADALSVACVDLANPKAMLAAVYDAVGDPAEQITEILTSYGIDSTKAGEVAGKITSGATTVEDACKDLGLPNTAITAIEGALGDPAARIAAVFTAYGVDPTTAATAAGQITSGSLSLEDACKSLGLPDAAITAVQAAIGTPAEKIAAIFTAYGIDPTTATAAATTIATAITAIETECKNLSLPQKAVDEVLAALGEGGGAEDIKKILTAYDIPEGTAKDTADKIAAEAGAIETAVTNIPISDPIIAQLWADADGSRAMIVAGLLGMQISPEDYQSVLDSLDEASGTISGRAMSVYDTLYQSLTDGLPDDASNPENSLGKAKQAMDTFYESLFNAVETWRAQKIEELKASGLTGDALEAAIQQVETQAEEMVATLTTCKEQSDAFVEANAGAAVSTVDENWKQLDAIITKVEGVQARIDVLNGKLNVSGGGTHRTAVEQGLVADQEGQIEAIAYSGAELKNALDFANQTAAAALAEAETTFAGDTQGYAKRRAEIMAQLESDEAAAYQSYDQHMTAILSGILQADPSVMAALDGAGYQQAIAKQATGLKDAIKGVVSDLSIDPDEFDFESFFSGLDVDWDALATEMGVEGGADALKNGIQEQMQTAMTGVTDIDSSQLFGDLSGITSSATDAMNSAISGMDLTSVGETWSAAMESGLISGDSAIDWTSFSTALTTGLDAIDLSTSGSMAAQGYGTGMAGEDLSSYAATTIANAESAIATAQGEGSPAAAFKPHGGYAAQGYGEGMASTPMSTYATTLVNAATSGLRSTAARGQAELAGKYIGSGFALGLASKKDSVVAVAQSIASAAAAAIRAALQISSPSRVTMRLGEYTGEGFELGLSDSLHSAVRTAETIVSGLNLAPNAMPDFEGALSGAASGAYNAEASRPIYLNVNGRQLAQVIARDQQVVSNNQSRRIALGVGK